jgi:hypothetical protein
MADYGTSSNFYQLLSESPSGAHGERRMPIPVKAPMIKKHQ